MLRSAPDRSYWAAVACCAAALALFSAPTLVELHQRWLSPSFTGGYLIVLLAACLFYRAARHGTAVGRPRPALVGALALGVCVAATLVGRAADIAIVAHTAFPMLLISFIWSAFGWPAVRRFLPSLLFLYFVIPFWQILDFAPFAVPSFNEGLRALTTSVVSLLIRSTGITAFIQGNNVHLPSGTFAIAEGCSGRGFFVAAMEISLFYGFMYLKGWRPRVLLVLAAVGLALVANWLRVYAIIVVGHLSEMQHPLVADHSTFGWVLFLLLVVGPMALIGNRLPDAGEDAPRPARAPGGRFTPSGPDAGHPISGTASSLASNRQPIVWAVPAMVMTMVAVGLLLDGRVQAGRRAQAQPSAPIALPAVTGWQLGGEWTGEGRPVYVEPTAEAAAWYVQGDARIGVYVANYAAQQQGREAVFYMNRPQGEADGEASAAQGIVTVPGPEGAEQFAEWALAGAGSQRLVWRSIRVAGRSTADEMMAKLYQVAAAFAGRTDAQVLVMSTACEAECSAARVLLSEFAENATAELYAAGFRSGSRD